MYPIGRPFATGGGTHWTWSICCRVTLWLIGRVSSRTRRRNFVKGAKHGSASSPGSARESANGGTKLARLARWHSLRLDLGVDLLLGGLGAITEVGEGANSQNALFRLYELLCTGNCRDIELRAVCDPWELGCLNCLLCTCLRLSALGLEARAVWEPCLLGAFLVLSGVLSRRHLDTVLRAVSGLMPAVLGGFTEGIWSSVRAV